MSGKPVPPLSTPQSQARLPAGRPRGASLTGPGKHSDHSHNCLIGKSIWANTPL